MISPDLVWPRLSALSLCRAQLGAPEAGALSVLLQAGKALRELDLQDNPKVGSLGARVLAQALPRCERLAVLDMREIPMSLEVADELAAGLPIWDSNIRPYKMSAGHLC